MAVGRLSINACLTAVLVVWAAAIPANVARIRWKASKSLESRPEPRTVDARTLISGRMPSMGSLKAPVVIVEFSDYQCPYCRASERSLQELFSAHPDKIAVYRYDFPIHPYSDKAAAAARCAAEQNVTEAYQLELFRNHDPLEHFDWVALAHKTGVSNLDRFAKCLGDDSTKALITHDTDAAKNLHVSATPTFFINNNVAEGVLSKERLEALYSDAAKTSN